MSCHSVQISLIQALLENKSYDISPKPTGGSGRRLTYPIQLRMLGQTAAHEPHIHLTLPVPTNDDFYEAGS